MSGVTRVAALSVATLSLAAAPAESVGGGMSAAFHRGRLRALEQAVVEAGERSHPPLRE